MRDDLERPTASVEASSGDLTPPDTSVPRICVVCGAQAGVCLVVAPACRLHGRPDAFTAALAEALAERDQANAFIAECSVCDGCGQNIGVYGWMRPFHSSVGPRALCSECMRKYIAGEIDALEPRL